jgi:hypothetical protein
MSAVKTHQPFARWIDGVQERIAATTADNGADYLVQSRAARFAATLTDSERDEFIEALGAVVVDMLVIGAPCFDKWTAGEAILLQSLSPAGQDAFTDEDGHHTTLTWTGDTIGLGGSDPAKIAVLTVDQNIHYLTLSDALILWERFDARSQPASTRC